MKTIKNVLIFVLLVAGSTAFAQQGCGKEGGAPGQKQGCPFVAQLNLNSEQQSELKKIKKDFHQKDSIASADFRKQREQLRIERIKSFKSLLNKEQLEKMENMQLMKADQSIFGTPGKNQKMQKQSCEEQCPKLDQMKRNMRQGKVGQQCQRRMQVPGSLMQGKEAMSCQQIGSQCCQQNSRFKQAPQAMLSVNERVQKQSAMMTKILNLDEKQSAKIQKINLKYALKDSVSMAERRKNQSGNMDRGAMRKDIQVDRDAKTTEIKVLLTNDQKAKYDEFLKGNKERGSRRDGQGGPNQRPESARPQENM
ncbi:MAG: hypothetical protein PHR38_03575 [Bacteroidales bacterium]|nr:hypothetical protein [Bacteroidales bacterium]MDD4712946.1 hypothetical protein [Bacteroidales bacterium]